MNLSRRHLITLAGGGLAASALAACGSSSGGLNGSSGSSASGGTASGPTLKQWYHAYGETGTKQAVTKYAAEYTKAKVNVTWQTSTDYMKMVSAALLTSDFPDVFESENGATLDMIKGGQVADLTEVLGDAKSRFSAPVLKRMTFQGKVWAIPQVIDMQLLYYRKSVLEKAGKQAPTTFADLVSTAKAVATSDMGGFFAGNDGGVGVLANLFIWASGHEQLNSAGTGAGFLDQKFYQALSDYQSFYSSSGLLKSASNDWSSESAFVNGETAMQWGGLWSLTAIQKALGDDFGVVAFPAFTGGKQAVPFGAYGACVAAKGKNVSAAEQYVKWLWVDQTDKQVDFANSYGTHIPSQTALSSKASKISSGAGAEAVKMVSQLGHASDLLWTGTLGTAYTDAVTNVVKKKVDPAKAFSSFASLATSEIKRVNS